MNVLRARICANVASCATESVIGQYVLARVAGRVGVGDCMPFPSIY